MSKFIEFGCKDRHALIRIDDISHVTSLHKDTRFPNSCLIHLKSGITLNVSEDIESIKTKLNGSNVVLEKPIPPRPIFPNDN